MQRLSLELKDLITAANPDGIEVVELLHTLSGGGFDFLLVARSLPVAFLLPFSIY